MNFKKKELNFSVLMSVYYKDNHSYLINALNSISKEQSLKPKEIILVKDGLLTEELNLTIDSFYLKNKDMLKIYCLPDNRGLANALNFGAKKCIYPFIARMDSDDIAAPDRFKVQLRYLKKENLDIVGGQIIEFGEDINDIISKRKVPLRHSQIIKEMKIRSPLSHPTVIFKKSLFDDINGYDTNIFPEDYDFFVRAYLKGYKFGNVPENVLWFRIGEDKNAALKRRHGLNYAKNEYKMYKKFRRIGYYSFYDFIRVVLIKIPLRVLPFKIFKYLYYNLFRKI